MYEITENLAQTLLQNVTNLLILETRCDVLTIRNGNKKEPASIRLYAINGHYGAFFLVRLQVWDDICYLKTEFLTDAMKGYEKWTTLTKTPEKLIDWIHGINLEKDEPTA